MISYTSLKQNTCLDVCSELAEKVCPNVTPCGYQKVKVTTWLLGKEKQNNTQQCRDGKGQTNLFILEKKRGKHNPSLLGLTKLMSYQSASSINNTAKFRNRENTVNCF